MRNPERIPQILKRLGNIWSKCPDLRLGQLIGNVADGVTLYYKEDDILMDMLEESYKNTKEV